MTCEALTGSQKVARRRTYGGIQFGRLLLVGCAILSPVACGSPGWRAADLPSQTLVDAVEESERTKTASVETATGADEPVEAPSAGADTGSPLTAEQTPPPTPAETPPAPIDRSKLTTVIEPGEAGPKSRSLLQAADTERKRRAEGDVAEFVVNDSNLSSYHDVPLTTATRAPGRDGAADELAAKDAEEIQSQESYWRDRIGGLRREWGEQTERKKELREQILIHREAFYATDDPFYRDAEVKPLWDRALAEFDEVNGRITEIKTDLELALEEGQRAGAFPGWLREGIDLEPEPQEERIRSNNEPSNGAEPVEPTTWGGRDDGGSFNE